MSQEIEKIKEKAREAAAALAEVMGKNPKESFEWCEEKRKAAERCGWPDLESATKEEIANAIYAALHAHREFLPERPSFERILTRALAPAFMEERVTQNRFHMAKHAHLWFKTQILDEMNAMVAVADTFFETLFPEPKKD